MLGFLSALHALGRFRLRTVRLPYAERAGTFLYDGLVSGVCPHCLASSCGGGCESCGHPNNFDELLSPNSTVDPSDPVSYREATILVLPMEEYRERLTAYFAEHVDGWRPHARQLVRELLDGPLPDVPVTVPGEWGIAAPFAETPGQILYPWVEAMPASIYATWRAAGEPAAATDELWRRESDAELVYFHGFDNVYHWALMDLVLPAGARGPLRHPGGQRLQRVLRTGRREVLHQPQPRRLERRPARRGAPRPGPVPPGPDRPGTAADQLRPGGVAQHRHRARLVQPWNALADALSLALAGINTTAPLPVTAAGRSRATTMADRFDRCYRLADFSPARAAETVLGHLARLRTAAEALDRR